MENETNKQIKLIHTALDLSTSALETIADRVAVMGAKITDLEDQIKKLQELHIVYGQESVPQV